jgi:hypothetical protein
MGGDVFRSLRNHRRGPCHWLWDGELKRGSNNNEHTQHIKLLMLKEFSDMADIVSRNKPYTMIKTKGDMEWNNKEMYA